MLASMRLLPIVFCAALAASSCSTFQSAHAVTSSLDLAQGGRAVGRIRSSGIERIHMRVDNRGPGALAFEVRDSTQRVLEHGEIGRETRIFEWRPLERDLLFTLEARDEGGAHLDYRLSGRDGIGVEWDLTHALR